MKRKLAAGLLLLVLCVPLLAQSRMVAHGARILISSVGAITITPASGQGITLGAGTNITGNTTNTGSFGIGGGTPITKVLSGTASLNFGATAAGACDLLTITVTGAAAGDTVALGLPVALATADNYQQFSAYVSTTNTVAVKRCNLTNATTALSDPAAATVRVTVIQF